MNKIVLNVLKSFAGKKRLQFIFKNIHRFSLYGMNYGNGSHFNESGELNALQYVKKSFNNDKLLTVFDVGANIGNYSKSLSHFFGDKIIIHSFEPSKKTFEIYLETTSKTPNIIPNNKGLGAFENKTKLYSNYEGSGLASLYNRNLEHFGISMDKSEEINISTIDIYCNENNIERIHFLKLDIEGHELDALKGAKEMINKNAIDFIQFEFGGCNIDSRTYFQDFFYLLKNKYRIYRILTDGLFEIVEYKEIYEVFITINYLAERIK